MIVVMLTAYTRDAGSMYSNSATTGNWEEYVGNWWPTWTATIARWQMPEPRSLRTLNGRLWSSPNRDEVSRRLFQRILAEPLLHGRQSAAAGGRTRVAGRGGAHAGRV